MRDVYWLYNPNQDQWVIGRLSLHPDSEPRATVLVLGSGVEVPLHRFSRRIPIKLPKRLSQNTKFAEENCFDCPQYEPADVGTELEETLEGGLDPSNPHVDCKYVEDEVLCTLPYKRVEDTFP